MGKLTMTDKGRIERIYVKMKKAGLSDSQLKVLEYELERLIEEKNDLIHAAVKYCV